MTIDRNEFLAHIGYIREDIAGVHERLDDLNGRTRTVESDVAVLKSRKAAPERRRAGILAGAGLFVGGLLTALYHALSGGAK